MLKSFIQKQLILIKKHKTLAINFGYLTLLKFITIVIPLFTMPYLLSVLGKEKYGLVIFAEAVIQYFLVLINFGFNFTATKDVSIHRNNKSKLSEIVSSVFIIKGAFFLLSLLMLWIILSFISEAKNYYLLFFLTMHLCLYEWIFPMWYFQGKEQMKYISIINLVSKLFFFTCIFIFVKNENDFLKVPLLHGLGSIIAGTISIRIVIKHGIKLRWQKISILKQYYNESAPLFLANIAGKIKMVSNKTILGIFIGMESVAFYDIADKIKQVFITFLEIVTSVLFPAISKSKDHTMVRKGLRFLFLVGLATYSITGGILSFGIPAYFPDYKSVISIFWIIGMLIFTQPVMGLINSGVLIVNNLKREYLINFYVSLIAYIAFLFMFYYLNILNLHTISFSLILSLIPTILVHYYFIKKNNLLQWII